jgi:CubicO group peptidase (beta-lactamase class C family)
MTKPLVSVAAMMLVEDGKIELTDPVSKFFPAFKGQQVSVARTDSEFARMTYTTLPADLLRHTAGLAYGEITLNAPVKDAYTGADFRGRPSFQPVTTGLRRDGLFSALRSLCLRAGSAAP